MSNFFNTLLITTCLIFFAPSNGQTSTKYIDIEWKNGSEEAKKIMLADFYYDALDNWSPFGSDIGHDTYYLYYDWKRKQSDESVRNFINEQLIDLGYPNFDISVNGDDPNKLKGTVDLMRNRYVDLNAIDSMLISLAFTQLFLHGHIQPEVKIWAEAAFSRESAYLDFWDGEKGEKQEREERMNQLLSDLRKATLK
jgi:uncharacterized protein YfeS